MGAACNCIANMDPVHQDFCCRMDDLTDMVVELWVPSKLTMQLREKNKQLEVEKVRARPAISQWQRP